MKPCIFISSIIDLPTVDVEAIKAKLARSDVAFVAKRDVPGPDGQMQGVIYFSCTTVTNSSFIVEIKLKSGLNMVKVTVRSQNKAMSELCKAAIARVLQM
jgi:Beta2-adaptin appendage, C-terminal sub-domain